MSENTKYIQFEKHLDGMLQTKPAKTKKRKTKSIKYANKPDVQQGIGFVRYAYNEADNTASLLYIKEFSFAEWVLTFGVILFVASLFGGRKKVATEGWKPLEQPKETKLCNPCKYQTA